MSQPKANQYQAYSVATRTVAKTRQVVMLYDGAIRFIKQAEVALEQERIEERFNLLSKASEIMIGLKGSIDFDNGGEIAYTLHSFYTNMSMRILGINFIKKADEAKKLCNDLIEELKKMRDVWDNIDHKLNSSNAHDQPLPTESNENKNTAIPENGIILSA